MNNKSHETVTLLRFIAITLIVAAHFDVLDYGGGGAALLMMIVGYNFSKFKLPKIIAHDTAMPIAGMIIKTIIPTLGFLLLLQAYYGGLAIDSLLLFSNLTEGSHSMGFEYWFIEVYVQIQIFMLVLLSFPYVRKVALTKVALFSFLLVSVGLFIVSDWMWDASSLYRRLPHLMLWIFAFGLVAQKLDSVKEKLFLTALFAVACTLYYGPSATFFSVSSLILIWNPVIKLPQFMMSPISKIASASLFIYLTHFQIKSVAENIFPEQPVLFLVAALVGGYCIAYVYQFTQREALQAFSNYSIRKSVALDSQAT